MSLAIVRRNSLVGLLGGAALAVALTASPAAAKDIPAFESKVKVGGPRTVHTGSVMDDSKSKPECKSDAWLTGWAVWKLGKVSKKEIEVKSIKITYRTAVDSLTGGQGLARGNGKNVWRTMWPKDLPGDRKDHSRTYDINKTVQLDGKKNIIFQSNYILGRTGGPADCGGESFFWFKLQPVD